MMHKLNNLDTNELLSKIQEFKKNDLKTATLEEISMKILETLSCMLVNQSVFVEGTRLYRIRKLSSDLSNMPQTFQDIWHPPADLIKTEGRVNLKGNPMLYTSTEQITPVYECDIKENDCYAIIQYTVKPGQSLIGYTVSVDSKVDGLNEKGIINNKIIEDFILSEFTKPVGKGTEYLYKISNVIARNFMDMPFCDAYVYPSVANYKKGWNVAIKPDSAIRKIDFSCVLICVSKGFGENGQYMFELTHKANALNGDKLIYNF